MEKKIKDEVRAEYTQKLFDLFAAEGEDVGYIASNAFNFPIVKDGEESWIKITVTIPKEDEGYDLREEYNIKLAAAADRKKKKEEKLKKVKEQA